MGNIEDEKVGLVGKPNLPPSDDNIVNGIIFICGSCRHPGGYQVPSLRDGDVTERANSGLPPCDRDWFTPVDHTTFASFFAKGISINSFEGKRR